jgi:hypothetical protein
VVLPCFRVKTIKNYADAMVDETNAFVDRLGHRGEFDVAPTWGSS